MHRSSYLRMQFLVKHYGVYIERNDREIDVLDIGSCDMNGSYRGIFDKLGYRYVGMDMEAGQNVDIVPDDIYHWKEIEDESFDLVVSGQVFEHMEYPWLAIREIARVLRPSGLCIIIAPSAGVEHKAPVDCYRYFEDGLVALAKWANLAVHHVSIGGVPENVNKEEWISDWNDGCLVAQKEPIEYFQQSLPFQYRNEVSSVYRFGYSDTYRIWEIMIRQACRKFGNQKKIALFGAAWIGDLALEILGDERVCFFVENSQAKIGKERHGKKILSFDDYVKVKDMYNCLITASYKASLGIRQQMEKAGAKGESIYGDYFL